MSTQIISEAKKKGFTVTEFCAGKGKVKYQITQRYEEDDNHTDEWRHVVGYVQLSKKDLEFILKMIEKEEKK